MFFELYDIYLHRKWKRAELKFKTWLKYELDRGDKYTVYSMQMYSRLFRAAENAKRKYLRNKRSLMFASNRTLVAMAVDRYRNGDDVQSIIMDKLSFRVILPKLNFLVEHEKLHAAINDAWSKPYWLAKEPPEPFYVPEDVQ